jgi:hypothetical protein
MSPAEIAQQEFLDDLTADGTNRGYATGVQVRDKDANRGVE